MTDENKNLTVLQENSRSILPIGEEANNIIKWASYVAQAPYYQKMGGESAIISIWLAARELGIPEMQALNGGMWCVQGRVILSSPMMNQMIWKAGHKIEKITHTAEICHLRGIRKDGTTWEEAFTLQDAKKAGLLGKDTWSKYPRKMLFHSAMRDLCRNFFPEVIGGCDLASDVIEMEEINLEDTDKVFVAKSENSKEEKEFMDALDAEKLEYIDEISAATSKSREDIIKQAAANSAKFFESFELYKG